MDGGLPPKRTQEPLFGEITVFFLLCGPRSRYLPEMSRFGWSVKELAYRVSAKSSKVAFYVK
jgi:hypothetical protein